MDILEQYNKENPEISHWNPDEYTNSSDSKIVQWLMRHSGGYIKNEQQANYIMIGFVILIILAFLFSVLGRNKFSLTPEEEKLFRGKTASEKLLIPQQRDQSLFNK